MAKITLFFYKEIVFIDNEIPVFEKNQNYFRIKKSFSLCHTQILRFDLPKQDH